MTEYSDREIIECLRNRKSYVVHYLFDRYLPMIRLMVIQMGGTGEDAKDLFQDALLIMLLKIDSRDFVLTCKFKTFLYSVCENLWKSILSKRQVSANYFLRRIDESSDQDFTEIYDNKLYSAIFNEIFETLDPVCKNILKRYWEEENPKNIAKELGYSYGYVRKKKCECQANLIERVKNHPKYISIKSTNNLTATLICK